MTTKDASVTMELSSPTPKVSVWLDEQLDVVGHALVGVVGGVALQLHAVVIGVDASSRRDICWSSSCRQRICSHWFR